MLPKVAWMGNSTLVGYTRFRDGYTIQLQQVDPFSGRVLGVADDQGSHPLIVDATGRPVFGLCVVSQASAQLYGSSSEASEAALFWLRELNSTYRYVTPLGRIFVAGDGRVVDCGYRCGSDAVSYAIQAISGNAGFTLRLRGAAPSNAVFLVMNTSASYWSSHMLGSPLPACTVVPASGGVFALTTTDPQGNASYPMPLYPAVSPWGLGMEVYSQWIVSGVSVGTTALPMGGTSNALWIKFH